MNFNNFILLINICELFIICKTIEVTEKNFSDLEWLVPPPQMETYKNYEDMQKYMDSTHKINLSTSQTMDSYILAYNLHHENYQDNEEKKAIVQLRRKRSTPPEFIRFELSDAKEPDERTRDLIKRNREQQEESMPGTFLKTLKPSARNDDTEVDPMITNESQNILKIYEPNYHEIKYINSVRKLPANIQNIVNMMLKTDQSKNRQPKFFHHKFIPQKNSKYEHSIPTPLLSSSPNLHHHLHHHQPEHQQELQQPKYYPFFGTPLKGSNPISISNFHLKDIEPIKSINYNFENDINLKSNQDKIQISSYSSLGDFEKKIIDEHNLFQVDAENDGNMIPKDDIHQITNTHNKYDELSTLIGKTPTDQLQGLTILLAKDMTGEEQTPPRSQDSTAPILFHPEIDKINHNSQYVPIIVGEENSQKDHKPIEETTTDDVMAAQPDPIHNNHNSLPKINVIHITPPPSLHHLAQGKSIPTPSPMSYQNVDQLSPNYSKEQLQQYASKYAFGYRVRDYHTGNDFGHQEKRDNDGTTRGQYHILLPDGRIQNVHYHADDSGFHAEVSYDGVH